MIEKIKVNCHSSINFDDIYIDPFKIENEIHNAKYIFITHSHYDHFSKEDYNKVMNDNTIFIIPKSMYEEVIKEIDAEKILTMEPYQKLELDKISVFAVPAFNTNKPMHKKEYNWLGYVLNINNEVIYVCGDMDYISENTSIKCDILCVPIGGTYTMNYKEAAEFTNEVKPKYVIPIHYGKIVGSKEDFLLFNSLVDSSIQVVNKIDL